MATSAHVDSASLRVFRLLFGLIMAASTLRFVANGWVETQLLAPTHLFAYPGFAFVRPLPAPLMYAVFALLGGAALTLALGLRPRLSALVFLLGFTYVELLDQTRYLNHYYLVSLLAFLLALVPWGGRTVPAAHLHALRLQVAVVYVFAGLAKLDHDWLVEAQPLKLWLFARSDLPLIGGLFALPATAHAFSIAGAIFDLGIVFFLLAPRTRPYAFALALAFHAITGLLFPIGVFPWLMSACLTLFLAPDWPRRWLPASPRAAGRPITRPMLCVLAVHCAVQLLVPAYQQLQRDSAWTYRGFDFAWRVMIAEKSGAVTYEAIEPESGARRRILPRSYLTPDQEQAFARDPALIWALGQRIAAELAQRGRVRVVAHASASLNGRPSRLLVDPRIALGPGDPPAGWVLSPR
jgi:vitamin K-dependent gamma-carboxylase